MVSIEYSEAIVEVLEILQYSDDNIKDYFGNILERGTLVQKFRTEVPFSELESIRPNVRGAIYQKT